MVIHPMTLIQLFDRLIKRWLEDTLPAECFYDLTLTKESREDTSWSDVKSKREVKRHLSADSPIGEENIGCS